MLTHADLLIYQGDDWAGEVLITNEDGSPADITGYSAMAHIRYAVADEDPLILFDIPCTVVAPDHISMYIPHAQTTLLSEQYVWDLQVVSPSTMVTTVIAGKVKLTQEVTRVIVRSELAVNHAR